MENIPRLAQTYGVSEDEICRANGLKPGEALCPGRKLAIPQPKQYKNIVPVYRNSNWKYIIVHHTAGENGKALLVDQMHRERGFEEGLGYHFLIDNGTLGKGNGQLEVAPRWIKQEEGAHCKASGMNQVGIGIGLVGNFNDGLPSRAQLHTLTLLVSTLVAYYHIPKSNILGHRQVPGARTDCPGTRFPWQTFEAGIKRSFST
jgi:N-acetyl-anhydromuramyl-L-alanine amidase AmpD